MGVAAGFSWQAADELKCDTLYGAAEEGFRELLAGDANGLWRWAK